MTVIYRQVPPHSPPLCLAPVQKTFKCKERLPPRVDALWKIEAGVVRSLTWDEDGRTITLGVWSVGDVVGQPLSRLYPYEVECLTTVTARELLLNSEGGDDLQQALLVHAWKSAELLNIVHQPAMTDRLLRFLEWLSGQFGQPVPAGVLLNLNLTHQVLADTLGTTRVTITRLLCQLEQAGKIVRSPHRSLRSFLAIGKLTRQSLILLRVQDFRQGGH